LLALVITPADEQDREQVKALVELVQEITGQHVQVAFVDQADTGEQPAQEAEEQSIRLEVITLPEARRGFVLLPRRWVVERTQTQHP
jgi:transposase